MLNEIDDELKIDFYKIFKVLFYRRLIIFRTFLIVVLFFVGLTFILPKKYSTDSSIYVNKSNDTNLAEINPFIISSLSGGQGLSSLLGGSTSGLQNEIDIMQSPLVMDKVIKENNLIYKKGPKKGEYISTASFLKKNISIENKKGSQVITISYKSKDPLLNYNVVNSIINNYQKVNEEINTKKAIKDKKLLEDSYLKTTKTLNQKLSNMKNDGGLPASAMSSVGMLAALKGHNKSVSGAIGLMQREVIDGQKSQIAVDQEIEKLKMVKSRLEWTNLVEKMSNDASNVMILKYPEIKRSFEYSQPKLLINFILGMVFAIFASLIVVIWAEITDKKLTYGDLSEKVIYDIEKNIDDLKIFLFANAKENPSLVLFDGFNTEILHNLQENTDLKIIKADINLKTINEILQANKLIFAAKVGQTPKKIYRQIKKTCIESNRNVYREVV